MVTNKKYNFIILFISVYTFSVTFLFVVCDFYLRLITRNIYCCKQFVLSKALLRFKCKQIKLYYK